MFESITLGQLYLFSIIASVIILLVLLYVAFTVADIKRTLDKQKDLDDLKAHLAAGQDKTK